MASGRAGRVSAAWACLSRLRCRPGAPAPPPAAVRGSFGLACCTCSARARSWPIRSSGNALMFDPMISAEAAATLTFCGALRIASCTRLTASPCRPMLASSPAPRRMGSIHAGAARTAFCQATMACLAELFVGDPEVMEIRLPGSASQPRQMRTTSWGDPARQPHRRRSGAHAFATVSSGAHQFRGDGFKFRSVLAPRAMPGSPACRIQLRIGLFARLGEDLGNVAGLEEPLAVKLAQLDVIGAGRGRASTPAVIVSPNRFSRLTVTGTSSGNLTDCAAARLRGAVVPRSWCATACTS